MKKYYFIILSLSLLPVLCYSQTFIIKLASFSNGGNLKDKIQELNPSLQENIHIIHDNNLSKAFVSPYPTKMMAQNDLIKYQKVFLDAYITTHARQKLPLKDNITPHPLPKAVKKVKKLLHITTPIVLNTQLLSLEEILEDQILYLCPNTISSSKQKLLIQATFEDNKLTYTTLLGKVPSLEMDYILQNERLYSGRNGQINPMQYSKVKEQYFEYYLFIKYSRGKILHKMRYYKNLEDAHSYLRSIR